MSCLVQTVRFACGICFCITLFRPDNYLIYLIIFYEYCDSFGASSLLLSASFLIIFSNKILNAIIHIYCFFLLLSMMCTRSIVTCMYSVNTILYELHLCLFTIQMRAPLRMWSFIFLILLHFNTLKWIVFTC